MINNNTNNIVTPNSINFVDNKSPNLKDVIHEMDELRQSNSTLEKKLNNVTSELHDMKNLMQEMLQMLNGLVIQPTTSRF